MERFEKLAEVCKLLGFKEEEAIYKKLVKDCRSSGIEPNQEQPEASAVSRLA